MKNLAMFTAKTKNPNAPTTAPKQEWYFTLGCVSLLAIANTNARKRPTEIEM